MSIIIATGEWDNTRHESLRMSGLLTQRESTIGSTIGNGVATIGIIGATCFAILTCRSYEQ